MEPKSRSSIQPGDDLSGADLSEFDFYMHYGLSGLQGGPGANLQNCKFIGTNFKAAIHYHTDFRGADLTGADLSQSQCFETIFGRGVETAPAILRNTNFTGAYLGGSHLLGVGAVNAVFKNANLEYCAVHGAIFESADFRDATLTHLNQTPSHGLRSVSFFNSNLANVDFSHSDLQGANFAGANLSGANFYRANIFGIITDEETVLTNTIGPDGEALK